MIFLSLFITFFEIGLFGFGGGYGMLSLIQHETVEANHWLSTAEFTDIVAISQMTPGPIGINSATYCGYTAIQNAGYGHTMAILGSATATFADNALICLWSETTSTMRKVMTHKVRSINTIIVETIIFFIRATRFRLARCLSSPSLAISKAYILPINFLFNFNTTVPQYKV